MKIGIDIDETVLSTYSSVLDYARKYALGINSNNYDDLNDKEVYSFLNKHIYEIQMNAELKPGAARVIRLLKEEGFEIIFITARGKKLNYNYEKVTKEYFMKYNIPYDKIHYRCSKKGKIAKKEKIDIFIDDKINNLDDVAKYGIECLHFVKNLKTNSKYKKFNDWEDILIYLSQRGS